MTMLKESPASAQLRVVFDTNVYIAAFLRPGLSEELVKRGLKGEFLIFISWAILKELKEKLASKFRVSPEDLREFINLIQGDAQLVYPKVHIKLVKQDPQDNMVLECAQAAEAQLIITLDKHLLRLKTWRNLAIVHPRTFTWIVPRERSGP